MLLRLIIFVKLIMFMFVIILFLVELISRSFKLVVNVGLLQHPKWSSL